MIRECQQCSKNLKTTPSRVKKGWGKFCSYKCAGESNRVFAVCQRCSGKYRKQRGNKKYCSQTCYLKTRKGYHHMEETKVKIGRANCLAYTEGRRRASRPMLGRHHSEETKKKLSEYFRKYPSRYWLGKSFPLKGNLSPLWKGDSVAANLKERARSLFQYKRWRSEVFKRDNYTCQFCFVRGGKLQVDHIKPLAQIVKDNSIKTTEEALSCKEMWNLNNGCTLCLNCHKSTPTYLKPLLAYTP